MNVDPPRPFDPSEALAHLADPDLDLFGLSLRTFFYATITCRAVESFAESAFIIDPCYGPQALVKSGCQIEFVIKASCFWLDVSPARVKLWTASADDADGARNKCLVHDGDSSDAKAWDGALQAIGRVERFAVFMNHADTLRRMWSEFITEQNRRREERGF